VQGPLGLNWHERKAGVAPRIENADLTNVNPPRESRLKLWGRLAPVVAGRTDWRFVKLHTHGALPRITGMFLGDAMRRFHAGLAEWAVRDGFSYHYVTAREMVNLIHAAEDGASGGPAPWLDHCYRLEAAHSS
jgi:hypothetical protein